MLSFYFFICLINENKMKHDLSGVINQMIMILQSCLDAGTFRIYDFSPKFSWSFTEAAIEGLTRDRSREGSCRETERKRGESNRE